jgi:hypothetical protein
MDSGSVAGFSGEGADRRCRVRRRKKEEAKRLKAEKRGLRRDLARCRRAGKGLEANMARLCRQRQKELSHERRAARSVRAREEAVTTRERACALFETWRETCSYWQVKELPGGCKRIWSGKPYWDMILVMARLGERRTGVRRKLGSLWSSSCCKNAWWPWLLS